MTDLNQKTHSKIERDESVRKRLKKECPKYCIHEEINSEKININSKI